MSLNGNGGGDMVMPVAPAYGNGGWGGGFGGFGGDGWWVILFLFALMGNGFGGWGGFGGGGMANDLVTFPYLLNTQTQNDVNRGFDNAGLSSQLTGIQSSIASGFAGAEVAECNRAMDAMQTAYNNQIASMNQRYADSQNLNNNLNNIAMSLQNCCCENRANIADLKYTIATENCADRAAVSDGIRDLLAATQAQTQTILDRMCQDKIDAKNDTIAQLRQELLYSRAQASQDVQTAVLRQGQEAEVDALYNRLNNCPVATVPVYGKQPIFSYGNSGCGCNGGTSFYN